MKRILLSLLGTVAGLVALLSFKTHTHVLANAGGLPSAAGPDNTSTPATPATPDSSPAVSSGASTSSAPKSTQPASATKNYVGTAIETQYGIVQVKVAVSGSKITNVSFVQLTAFDGRSQEINSQAAPILLQETLAAQSAQIDTVSGATYTSDGYVQSLQSALDQAGLR